MKHRIVPFALFLLLFLPCQQPGHSQEPENEGGSAEGLLSGRGPDMKPLNVGETKVEESWGLNDIADASAEVLAPFAEEGLRLNLRGVPLDQVLDYLSRAAGFVIVREAQVEGTVDVVSHRPLSSDEAAGLLDTILARKGYAAIRNGRVLTIVEQDEALARNLPVRTGNRPEMIPPTDEMVTQIIPVRYIDAVGLVENLRPLLPSYADLSANRSSNSILLTDTQANIRRIVEIVQAFDTSVSESAVLKVFSPKYGNAQEMAQVINELFKPEAESSRESSRGRRGFFFERPEGEGERSSAGASSSGSPSGSARVKAVADEKTNSLVVSAPEEVMPTVEALVGEMDRVSVAVKELRVFPLLYADAKATAQLITDVFQGQTRSTASRDDRPPWFRFGRRSEEDSAVSALEDYEVVAQADERTNSVVVLAQEEILEQIGRMIRDLDNDPARKQKVFIYDMKNADAQQVSDLLQGMFGGEASQTRSSGSARETTSSTERNAPGEFRTRSSSQSSTR